MKKTLLLSAVASTIAFAGGDIAPVEPVVPAAAAPAACDFWGSIGARYDAVKDSASRDKFGKGDDRFTAAIVLGVEKELGYGFGFGAELAGFYKTKNAFKKIYDPATGTYKKKESAELSQLYLTYKYGNTAIKAGRQALPKSLSPWAWSDRTVGALDNTFEGIVVVNTDLADTTLVGAWIASRVDGNDRLRIDKANETNKGLFMLTAQYKGIENTTLTGSLYYVPKFLTTNEKAYSAWASAETKVDNFDLGLQLAYAKTKGSKATTGIAAYAGTNYEGLDAKLTLAYLKNGGTTLALGGTSAFWGNTGYSTINGKGTTFGSGAKEKIVKLDLGYNIDGYGRVYGGVAYDKISDSTADKAIAARVGYQFNVAGVDAKVEYRYDKVDYKQGADHKKQTIRVEGIYKF